MFSLSRIGSMILYRRISVLLQYIFSCRVLGEGFGSEVHREAKWLANESDFLPSRTSLLTSLRCAPILFLKYCPYPNTSALFLMNL